MQDRRMFERFQVDFPVKFLDLNNSKEGMGRMINISAGGGGMIITEEQLEPTTPLEMWFPMLENKDPFHTNGKVVWSDMLEPDVYRVGVKFDKVDFAGVGRVLRDKEA